MLRVCPHAPWPCASQLQGTGCPLAAETLQWLRVEQATPRRERLEMPDTEHMAQVHVEDEASRLSPPRGVQGLCRKLKLGTVRKHPEEIWIQESSPSSPRGLLGEHRVRLSIGADPCAWPAGSVPHGR